MRDYVNDHSFFILSIDKLSSNSVKSSSTFIGDNPSIDFELISFLIFLDNFLLLQLLKSPSDNFQVSMFMSGVSAGNSVLLAIEMRQQIHTGSRSQVNFSSQGGNTNVNPVVVQGSEFSGCI